MKVQLQGQALRLRIDEAELARLQAGDVVENRTCLPEGEACLQQLRLGEATTAMLTGSAAAWVLALPAADLSGYVQRLPCKNGLLYALTAAGGETLQVEFEVDVRDSARVRGKAKR